MNEPYPSDIMNELDLENEAVSRTLQECVRRREETLVRRDLVRLEQKRVRQQLNVKTERVFTAENRLQQLHISRVEREKEVEVHQEVLKSKLRYEVHQEVFASRIVQVGPPGSAQVELFR